jgi:hypothetical protein
MNKAIYMTGLSSIGLFLAITSSAQLEDIQIHGFVSQGYVVSSEYNYQTLESKNGTLELNEMAINISADVVENLRAGVQLMSRDYGYVGNNQVVVDWAYGDYSYSDHIGLRVGRVKIPMGFYNETRDIDLARTSIFLPQSVYNESYRDVMSSVDGLSLYGIVPMGGVGDLQYKFVYGHSALDTENSGLKAYPERTEIATVNSITGGENATLDFVWLTPLEGLRLGSTLMYFEFDSAGTLANPAWGGVFMPSVFSSAFEMVTASAEYMVGDLTLSSEFRYFKGETDITVSLPSMTAEAKDMYETAGSYIGAAYRFSPLFELGSYYSFTKDVEDRFDSHDVALSARFDINDFWIVKLEGHWLNGSMEAFPLNGNPALSESDGKDWFMFAMKTTFSF